MSFILKTVQIKLIEGMIGGHSSLVKNNLQVCESQK